MNQKLGSQIDNQKFYDRWIINHDRLYFENLSKRMDNHIKGGICKQGELRGVKSYFSASPEWRTLSSIYS